MFRLDDFAPKCRFTSKCDRMARSDPGKSDKGQGNRSSVNFESIPLVAKTTTFEAN